jgi:hypothetical protein
LVVVGGFEVKQPAAIKHVLHRGAKLCEGMMKNYASVKPVHSRVALSAQYVATLLTQYVWCSVVHLVC